MGTRGKRSFQLNAAKPEAALPPNCGFVNAHIPRPLVFICLLVLLVKCSWFRFSVACKYSCPNIPSPVHPPVLVCGLWVFCLSVCLFVFLPVSPLVLLLKLIAYLFFLCAPETVFSSPCLSDLCMGHTIPEHLFNRTQRPRRGLSCEFYLMDKWTFRVFVCLFQLLRDKLPLLW